MTDHSNRVIGSLQQDFIATRVIDDSLAVHDCLSVQRSTNEINTPPQRELEKRHSESRRLKHLKLLDF